MTKNSTHNRKICHCVGSTVMDIDHQDPSAIPSVTFVGLYSLIAKAAVVKALTLCWSQLNQSKLVAAKRSV